MVKLARSIPSIHLLSFVTMLGAVCAKLLTIRIRKDEMSYLHLQTCHGILSLEAVHAILSCLIHTKTIFIFTHRLNFSGRDARTACSHALIVTDHVTILKQQFTTEAIVRYPLSWL